MVRCGCGGSSGECGCTLVAGNNTTVTGSGSPWVVNAVTNCSQVRTCLSAGCGVTYNSATGAISAAISANAGNALQCLPNGLFVQTGAATVTAGCGLTGTGAPGSPLTADTGAWPYACDIATQGGVVACDPATGQLYSEPRSRSQMSSINEVQAYANLAVPAGAPTVVRTISGNFTNPDPCRTAIVVAEQEVEFDLNLPPNARATYGFTGDDMVTHINRGATTENGFAIQATKVLNRGTIAPGATVNYSFDALVGNGTNGATYSNIQQILRILFITQ